MASQSEWFAHLMAAEPQDIPLESAIMAEVFTQEEWEQMLSILAGALSRLSTEQQTKLWAQLE